MTIDCANKNCVKTAGLSEKLLFVLLLTFLLTLLVPINKQKRAVKLTKIHLNATNCCTQKGQNMHYLKPKFFNQITALKKNLYYHNSSDLFC